MTFYIVGECACCVGSGDLLALISIKNSLMFYYCPACGLAWDEIPDGMEHMEGMDFYAPDGARPATLIEVQGHGISNYVPTDSYDSFEDIL